MESNIKFHEEEMHLVEDYMDIGYMAENIEVEDIDQKIKTIKRSHSNKSMTLLVSCPTMGQPFSHDIERLEHFMRAIVVNINCYFIFDSCTDNIVTMAKRFKKFEVVFDKDNEFGEMYGCRIVSGSLKERLTKSLFLISKDGAIFYLDIPQDLEQEFNLERLQIELNKAYTLYTGVGCHE